MTEHDTSWDGNHKIKHKPVLIKYYILVPSLPCTQSYIFISSYSLIACPDAHLHSPKIASRACKISLFLLYPSSYACYFILPRSQRQDNVIVFNSICYLRDYIKQYSIPAIYSYSWFLFPNSKSSLHQIYFRIISEYLFWNAIETIN